MTDSQLSADVTRPHSLLGKLYNSLSHNIGKRAAIDEETSELVDSSSSLSYKRDKWLKKIF